MSTTTLLEARVTRQHNEIRPAHHVVVEPSASVWSWLPAWTSPSDASLTKTQTNATSSRSSSHGSLGKFSRRSSRRTASDNQTDLVGFRNPWPSWHKPTRGEVWQALEWGDDLDPCIQLAASHLRHPEASPAASMANAGPQSTSFKQQALQLLKIPTPDFDFDVDQSKLKATWLGHAGVLVQLRPLQASHRPLCCLFDPMFSMRCSPSQAAGPIRSHLPPCKVKDLPEIDVVMISHNHYDHLDYDTIMAVWNRSKNSVRFVVPLGNRSWFLDSGIDPDRVIELDWWDTVRLFADGTNTESALTITCTPAQHNSGRASSDANSALWSSWYLQRSASPDPDDEYRVFFAGDTGYQFHRSSQWPPSPPPDLDLASATTHQRIDDTDLDEATAHPYPACPAFAEISSRLGAPHFSILPVAVGASYDYFRSFVPLPDSVSPFPRHRPGLTAHNHMPPWDAVRVFNLMTTAPRHSGERSVAMGMHWGTFVSNPVEILKTLGQLEWACTAQGVDFARALSSESMTGRPVFLALDHGQSVTI